MDINTNHNTDPASEEMNLFGELRTIPAQWDVSSIADNHRSLNNGRVNMANYVNDDSENEKGSPREYVDTINYESSITFDEWYLGAYLDMDNDTPQRYWCAF